VMLLRPAEYAHHHHHHAQVEPALAEQVTA
jgi:hypothetical protein